MTVALFTFASFLTAGLLFLVQPMVGKMVLPAFGGSPQVWTTAMLFFQMALLAGYGYTHLATTRLAPRRQVRLHLGVALLPLVALPIALAVEPSGRPGLAPSLELLVGLVIGVAAPFVLVATSGPLLQRWFSWTDHPRAHDPYFLYAAGNAGSVTGLLAYPFLLERWLDVPDQSLLWAGGYVLMLAFLAACAWRVRGGPVIGVAALAADDPPAIETPGPAATPAPSGARQARWVLLAFVASSLMLAVTTHLSTDVAAVPLLWIVPLALYLATFVAAFATRGPGLLKIATALLPAVAVAALAAETWLVPVRGIIAIQLALVAVGGLVAHGQLAADRPDPALLTRYYLLIAVGGAAGGLFNAILAPLVFPAVWEHPVTVLLALYLVVHWRQIVPGLSDDQPPMLRMALGLFLVSVLVTLTMLIAEPGNVTTWAIRGLLIAAVVIGLTPLARGAAFALGALVIATVPAAQTLTQADDIHRTFFGVHRILQSGDELRLLHGTTIHGSQDTSTLQRRLTPTTYYHPDGPVGDLLPLDDPQARVGTIGLGAGAIAAYGQPGQTYVFHEIDPVVVDLAQDRFTYLRDSRADVEVVLGDGRLTIERLPDATYDVLLVDAFSSDAIPVHLLTVEAVESYLAAVGDGIVAIHISNRYLDLLPVVAGASAETGAAAVVRSAPDIGAGGTGSVWTALARDPAALKGLTDAGWSPIQVDPIVWTDRRSDLVSVLR